MSADRAPDQPRQCQAVEPPILTVTGCGGEHQGQIARFSRAGEPPLQRHDQFVWSTDADKARAADAVAIANQRDRFVSGDNLVFHSAELEEEVNVRRPRRRFQTGGKAFSLWWPFVSRANG